MAGGGLDPRGVERFAKNVEKDLRGIGAALEDHRQHINRLNNQAFRTMAADPHEQANRYNAVILGIGYAGFFALWNQVGGVDSPKLHAVAGFLIGVSLFLFVALEVLAMFNTARVLHRKKPLYSEETGRRFWYWSFCGSVATAVVAALCVFAILVQKLAMAFH